MSSSVANVSSLLRPVYRDESSGRTASTIARMPALTCDGMRGHAATSDWRSASPLPLHGSAVVSAVTALSAAVSSCSVRPSEAGSPFPKPGVAGSNPAGRATLPLARRRIESRKLADLKCLGLRDCDSSSAVPSHSLASSSTASPSTLHDGGTMVFPRSKLKWIKNDLRRHVEEFEYLGPSKWLA